VCLPLGGCGNEWTATPLPEPPALDGQRIHRPDGISTLTGDVTIVGDARSASPGATVRVTNLETTDEPATATVAADGSFTVEVPATDGDELRIDAVSRDGRSEPIDVILGEQLTPSPRHTCVTLSPADTLEFSESTAETLVVRNRCDSELSLEAPRSRLSLPYFTLETELPMTLAESETGALDFAYSDDDAAEREDVFFVDIDVGGEVIRYPVTLYAPAAR
jgi:hypothetical protein